ncbi:hypothetical protein BJF85_04460 [Saccharomonospora sp. CUA-673]|nr:hypothetical protein BJF85_04460 [Saccharomonospora sp. CUA-673]
MLAVSPVSQTDPLFLAEMILAQGSGPRFMAKTSLFQSRAVGWWFRPAATSRSIVPTAELGSAPRSKPWTAAPSSSTRKVRSRSGRMDV